MDEKCLFCESSVETYQNLSTVRFWYDCDYCGEYAHSKKMRGQMDVVRAWAAANRESALAEIRQANSRHDRLYFTNVRFKS